MKTSRRSFLETIACALAGCAAAKTVPKIEWGDFETWSVELHRLVTESFPKTINFDGRVLERDCLAIAASWDEDKQPGCVYSSRTESVYGLYRVDHFFSTPFWGSRNYATA